MGVGDATAGLCGGMSWFVRERFENGAGVPADTTAPENGSPLFRAIVRRQILSLDWLRGPLRFWLSAATSPDRLRRRTLDVEWPRIRAEIDAGRLQEIRCAPLAWRRDLVVVRHAALPLQPAARALLELLRENI